ncbi:hypothetical protein HED49_07755 [Ochrobactrum daejeonense]|nr:hypothetical protein [Brucella daejeonensis]
MSWSKDKSLRRIQTFKAASPSSSIEIKTFDESYLQTRQAVLARKFALDGKREPLIFDIPENAAIRVEGVHVYIQMLDFSSAMIDRDRETEASHKRVLSMLHLNYAACDQVAEEYEAQRVDFHGSRMHAVIVSPPGEHNARQRSERALAFADAVTRAISAVGAATENGRYSTRIRVGVDSGTAIAINSGTRDEREPLFWERQRTMRQSLRKAKPREFISLTGFVEISGSFHRFPLMSFNRTSFADLRG